MMKATYLALALGYSKIDLLNEASDTFDYATYDDEDAWVKSELADIAKVYRHELRIATRP